MSLAVNLRHLEAHNVRLQGELPVAQLDLDPRDEAIQLVQPLEYDVEIQKLEDGLLAKGKLRLDLDCECVRCLKPFQHRLELNAWACHLPFQGEGRACVVNDCVDLTPYVREDILLEFPQHPLCDPECRGLPGTSVGKPQEASNTGQSEAGSSAWAALNKLRL
jgi:uncharacterized protein